MRCNNKCWVTGPSHRLAVSVEACSAAIGQVSDRIVPCPQVVCTQCNCAVLTLDGVKLENPYDHPIPDAYASLDPIEWLAYGVSAPSSRAYACACSRTTIVGAKHAGHLDTHNIDGWTCASHVDNPPTRPVLRTWRAAVHERLVPGVWFVLDDAAYGILDEGSVRRQPWTEDPARDLPSTFVAALNDDAIRWIARQLGSPRTPLRPLFAVVDQSWVHGNLDAQRVLDTYADVPALIAGLRAHAKANNTQTHTVAPALLHGDGYLTLSDYT